MKALHPNQYIMKRITFAALLVCFVYAANAQNLRLSYFGETATHYGIRGGTEFTLSHVEKAKPRGTVRKDLLLGINLTVYRHPNNHIGAILSPELSLRRTGKGGGVLQAAISPGLFRSFYEATTWRPTEDGGFEKVPLAGQWGFLPGISLGFGHDFSVKGSAPLMLFMNLHYMQQYPYNTSFQQKAAVEVGILFKKS